MMNRHGKGPYSTLPQQPITNFDSEKLAEEGKAFMYGSAKSVLPGLAGLGAGVLGLPTTGPGGFAIGLGAGAAVYQAQENYLDALDPQTNKDINKTMQDNRLPSLLGSLLSGFGSDKIGRNLLSSMKNIPGIRMLPSGNGSVRPDLKSAGQEAMEEFFLRSRPSASAPLDVSKADKTLPLLRSLEEKGIIKTTQSSTPNSLKPQMKANGGIIYASTGTLVNYQPRGTDTVPAMLTPGEFVVNARSTAQHLPLLQAINGGADPSETSHFARGGLVGLLKRKNIARSERLAASADATGLWVLADENQQPYRKDISGTISTDELMDTPISKIATVNSMSKRLALAEIKRRQDLAPPAQEFLGFDPAADNDTVVQGSVIARKVGKILTPKLTTMLS